MTGVREMSNDTMDEFVGEQEGDFEQMTFEQAIKELEEIVAKLESGKTSLEEALKLFERGVKLAKLCERKLRRVERRLKMVVKTEEGEIEFRDFELEEEGDLAPPSWERFKAPSEEEEIEEPPF
ncbi:MAG: hypothetical protein HZRFUVUK_001733 [Candidatus Fervidibacterota bacterium]|jgi:exodeoxyribonuclease VII small subunit